MISPETIYDTVAKLGKTPCYLLRHPWNQNKSVVEGVEWVDTWSELTKRLLARVDTK